MPIVEKLEMKSNIGMLPEVMYNLTSLSNDHGMSDDVWLLRNLLETRMIIAKYIPSPQKCGVTSLEYRS